MLALTNNVAKKEQLQVNGRSIAVSNLDKVLYPGHRFTKAKVLDYYVRVSKYLLPHLKDRPVTLKRFPNGVYGEFFYEKDAPAFTPDWVETFPVPRRERNGPDIRYVVINDLPTLVWLANLANLEIHPFLYRVPRINRPTWIVFDLDPGKGADILTCARVAFMLRELLKQLALESFPKVSGSKGLQIYIPLNTAVTYEETQPFAKAIAELLAAREPNLIVAQMPKVFRSRKVFIDWSQNSDFKSTVSVYSLRAKTYKPFVSMPVTWDELRKAVDKEDSELLYFEPEAALQRVERLGDLFKSVLTRKQKLPHEITSHAGGRTKTRANPISKKSARGISNPKAATTIRRSRQGSRRRFIVYRRPNGSARYELGLEIDDALKSWTLAKRVPVKRNAHVTANINGPSRELDRAASVGRGRSVWDAGNYELVEGSYGSGFMRFYLTGEKFKGEWTLLRENGKKTKWKLTKTGGK